MVLVCKMAVGASPQGLGTLPTTTMRRPGRLIASTTLTYWKVIAVTPSPGQCHVILRYTPKVLGPVVHAAAAAAWIAGSSPAMTMICHREPGRQAQGGSRLLPYFPLNITLYAAFFALSAIVTSALRIPVAPLSRSFGVSHSSKNTTFMSGRTRAPTACLAI